MNAIQELLKTHCPNGVEYKVLSKICNVRAGDRIIKSMMNDDEKYPVMGGGVEPTGYYHNFNFNYGITIARAGSAGFVSWQNDKFWATDVCFVVSGLLQSKTSSLSLRGEAEAIQNLDSNAMDCNNKLRLKYIYYFIKNHEKEFKNHLYGASMPKLDKSYLWNLRIPIPPLIVQEKIVTILDTFTELEAELEARKKQYAYYREKLLSFDYLDSITGGGALVIWLWEIFLLLGTDTHQARLKKNIGKMALSLGLEWTTFGQMAES